MGGHMASLSATAWPKPLAVVNFLGPETASGVFTKGVLSYSCDWENIKKHLQSIFPNNTPNEKEFMRKQMDEVTAIRTYPKPVYSKASIIYGGKRDAYVPLEDIVSFKECWPDSEIRILDCGHVEGFINGYKLCINAITEAFNRLPKSQSL
jgi:hypothetical protein